jgi:MinD-like ATPase involved in chromosome partitioning or flagellar assembly
MGVTFLGSIPLDPQIGEACDSGQPFVRRYAASPTAALMRTIIQPIAALAIPGPIQPRSLPAERLG